MQTPPRSRGSVPPPAHSFDFEQKLEGEEPILDAMLLAFSRGQLRPETWDALHAAAQRDERVSELAFAYESVAQGKRLKTMPPQIVAEFLHRGATFFADVLGDDLGATQMLERALAAMPAHSGAFDKLEELLTKAGDPRKLADLYASMAQHRGRPEQLAMLRRAAVLFEKIPGGEEKAVEIHQQVLRLDPADELARGALEARYLKANRHRDIARLFEQALALTGDRAPAGAGDAPSEPPIPEAEALRLRARLIDLYAGQLHEPERTMPHIEALLAKDPTNDAARGVAVKLLGVKGLAARAAAALADAYDASGFPKDVVRYLAIELEHTRGPKRLTVLRRLGIIKQDKLDELDGAYEAFEQALALDPSDDEVRLRYGSLALQLGKVLDAARTLQRVATAARESHVRARLAAEMGELYRLGGDAKKAKATFIGVLAAAGSDATAMLKSARALSEMYEQEGDHRALTDVLEKVADLEPDETKKRLANEKLADLAFRVLKDPARSIDAWRKLVDTPSRPRALEALEPLYEQAGSWKELAFVLEERAKDAPSPRDARALLLRAAEVLTTKTSEAQRASDAWKRVVEKYGASREVFAQWVPLLEGLKQWPELADALAADAQLAPEAERAALYARLALVRLQKTREVDLAIDAFKRALAADPAEKTSRGSLEKMLDAASSASAPASQRGQANEHRLAAAAVLDPLYRAEGNTQGLLRVLELKAALTASPDERMAALEEATHVAEANPAYVARAIDFAGRGLAEAVANDAAIGPWLDRMARLGSAGVDPKRRAALLAKALGEREVGSSELLALARTAGEALAECGDVAGALGIYRRALAFEPSNSELVTRVDELLRDQGSPGERVALYRAALERGVDAKRRRELLHAIGALERGELGNPAAAVDAYRAALDAEPDDREAHAALVELYGETAQWDALCDLLDAFVARATPDEARRARAQLAEIAAAHGQAPRAEAQLRALLGEHDLGDAELDAIERVAQAIASYELLKATLGRRAFEAGDPRDQVQWLEKLAHVELENEGDRAAAAESYRRAGRIALGASDDDAARALFGKVRELSPEDAEAARALADVCERAGEWSALPELFDVLLAADASDDERRELLMRVARVRAERLGDLAGAVSATAEAFALDPRDKDVLAAFEHVAAAAGEAGRFARAMDEAVLAAADDAGDDAPLLRADLRMAKGRALSADPARHADASAAYREVLESDGVDESRTRAAMGAFEGLLGARADDATAKGDRRWLCRWRFEHAAEADKVHALLAWAEAEEALLRDPARALELHKEVLALDAENAEALGAVSRLALATGDVQGAIDALVARRDRAGGEARLHLDLEIATILLDRTERLADALTSVASVLESTPNDDTALALAGRLLAVPSTRAQAIEMLEKTFDVADESVRVRIVETLLGDPGASPERRQDWYERLLDLLENQGRDQDAYDVVLRAVEQLPAVPALWDRAESLARALKSPDGVATLFHRALALPMQKDDALELGKRAVAFYEEWFEDSDRVVKILERILEIDPTESWAFDRLKLLFDAAERWDDLFALYDRALLAADDETKIALLEDAAQIAKDFANHSKRAIGYLEQLLALKPNNARLSASLERLYERHGCHRELIALLTAQLPRQAHKEGQETRARIAALWLDELGDATNALLIVEDILAREEGAERATVDVTALLERVLAAAPANAELRESISAPPTPTSFDGEAERPSVRMRVMRESVPPGMSGGPKRTLVRQRAAALLKERYVEQGRDADLVRILEVELEAVKNAKERIRRHQQIAALYRQLGNESQAMEHYVSLVLLEPDVVEHREKLAELAEKIGREDRLAEVLVAAADDCTDDALRVELLMQAGVVQADKLKDAERAIDLFFRVLLVTSIAEGPLYKACRHIEPLLAEARRVRERLDVLERLALLEPDEEGRREVLSTAARLATDLGETDRAIWAWEALLEVFPTDADALNGLVELLGRDKRWRRLIEILKKRAAATVPGGDPRADRVRVATILAEELAEVDEAIVSWRDVEKEFGESDESTMALIDLLEGARKWAELAELLERAAARAADAGDAASQANLLRALGDVQREHLGGEADAIASYGAALRANPREKGARDGLHALVATHAQRAAAVPVLLEAYRTCDEWSAILELTQYRLDAAGSDEGKVAILLETATIAEERAGDLEAAFTATRGAFLLAPHDRDVEDRATRLAEATRQWRSLAEAQRASIDARDARGDKDAWLAGLRFRMGEVLETKLDDPRAALVAYQRVAQDAPSDLVAAAATVRVAARVMRWDAAAKVVLESSRAAGELAVSLVEGAEEAATSPGAWDAATAAFAAAVGERSDVSATIARDLEGRIARWHRDRRGDPDAAEAAYVRALAHDAGNAQLLSELAQIQRRSKGRPLVESLLRLSTATGGDLDLLREAAEITTQSVGDRSLAKSILERLLKLATERWLGSDDAPVSMGMPGAPSAAVEWALRELVRIHDEEGDAERIVELLVDTAKLPFSTAAARGMRHDAARIALGRLGDEDRAIALYMALFEEDTDDERAVQRLEEIYETRGERTELLALKRKQIGAARDADRRIELRLQAARLLAQLGDAAGSIATLRESLAEEPRHPDTVRELLAILEKEKRAAELAQTLAEQAKLAETAGAPAEAADAWARAARVAEESLGDVDAAIAHHRRVIALEERAASLDALARLSTQKRDFDGAAGYLERLHAASAMEARAEITLRLAEAYVAAGKDDVARARLERAVDEDPAAEDVRARLAEMYRAKGELRALAGLLTKGAAHAPDKATTLARLREAADLHLRAEDPAAAIPLLEQASDLEPEDRAIRLALGDALGAAGRFDEARQLLRVLIEGFAGRRPKERAPVHYHLARLDLAVGDRARALVELDQATRIDPANPEILRALAELARDDGQLERAERSYRALLAVLRRQDDADKGAAGARPISRSEVLLELASIAERQGEVDRAKEIVESALEVAMNSDNESRRLEGALRARGDYVTLARALEARLGRASAPPSTAAEGLGELAEVLETYLGRRDDALAARLRAVKLAPGNAALHDAALALALREGQVTRYVDHLAELTGVAEESRQSALACELLLRMGAVVEKEMHDDRRAAAIYERAERHCHPASSASGGGAGHSSPPASGARSADVLRALDRIYERVGDEAGQARMLAMRVELEQQSGALTSDPLFRLAALRLRSKEKSDEGCELLAQALEREADWARAEEILRAAVAIHASTGGSPAQAKSRARVLELYERVARQSGNDAALVDALARRWRVDGGAEIMREAILLAQKVDGALAEQLLRELLAGADAASDAPTRAWALATLAGIQLAAGDVAGAVENKRAAAELAEPDDARRLRFDVARLAADALGDLALAADTYEALHANEPADREAWEPLAAVYRRMGAAEKLVALLGKIVEYVEEPSERSRLRAERVKAMMVDLGMKDEEAIPALREIVEDDPGQLDAAIQLASILERLGRDEELAELLARQLDAAKDRGDGETIASLSVRLGALLEKRDKMEAKDVYYTALDWAPQNRAILEALVKLHEGGEPSDRADVMERLLALETSDGAGAEKLALELAQIRTDAWDEDGALRALEIGFKACPTSNELRERLEATYRDKSAWPKLAELATLDARGRANAEEKVARLCEAASIYQHQLMDPASGAKVLREARAIAPDDPSLLGELVGMLTAAGDFTSASDELTKAIDALGDPNHPALPSLLAQRASMRANMGDDAGALDDMELAYLAGGASYVRDLATYLEQFGARAEEAGDVARWRALRLRLAELLPLVDDQEGARTILAELLKHDAKDRDALAALAQLEEVAERWDAASAAYRRLVALEEGEDVVGTALRLADACERAGRLADARGGLERARRAAPLNSALRRRLELLYEQTAAFRELAEMSLEDAKAALDVAGRFTHLMRAGALLLQQGGDAEAAVAPLEEAHALRPADVDCIVRLADAYIATGRTAQASEVVTGMIAQHKGRRSREQSPLYHRLARIARATGDDLQELAHLNTALDMDSQNGAAASELAMVAMAHNQLEVATRALRAITMLKTSAPMSKALAYQYLGDIARRQGDKKRAMVLLKRAVDDDPNLATARELLDQLEQQE